MIILERQASRFTIKTVGEVQARTSPTSKRGVVSTFSRKSRKRLLDIMASLDLKSQNRPTIFITLTYGQKWPDDELAKAHLKAFLMRVRRFAPQASGFWRVELQERGAPHFHFVLFNLPYLPYEEMNAAWLEIIGNEFADNSGDTPRCPFTDIQAIASTRKAFAYVSKYIAKSSDAGDSDSKFNSVPYQHDVFWQGRHWGILNKEELPFGELFEYVMETDELSRRVFFQFKRLMARKFGGVRRGKYMTGATLYLWSEPAVQQWFEAFIYVFNEAIEETTY